MIELLLLPLLVIIINNYSLINNILIYGEVPVRTGRPGSDPGSDPGSNNTAERLINDPPE